MTEIHTERVVPPTEPLSHAVVVAVAEHNGVDPLDLDERLYDCIDPDALDRLFASAGDGACGTVQFVMAGCHVEVSADRRVRAQQLREGQSTAGAYV